MTYHAVTAAKRCWDGSVTRYPDLANVGAAWIVINATAGPAATDGAVAIKKESFHEYLDQQPRQGGLYAFEMTGLADLTCLPTSGAALLAPRRLHAPDLVLVR